MLRVKNWSKFQHYNDRRPPWIKLSRELLENYEWACLQDASKALLVSVWLLAAEHEDPTSGLVTDDYRKIAFRVRMDEKKVFAAIKDLINHGFITHEPADASDLLAPCYQHATTETETETENRGKVIDTISENKKGKLSLDDLGTDHIAEWLSAKRAQGKYLLIDEFELLEKFKDYCKAKNPKYKDLIAAFRNSFDWQNAPKKGNSNVQTNSNQFTKSQRADAALDQAFALLEQRDRGHQQTLAIEKPS